ncbi:MAG: VWA domain-containing protein [Verrucomicrobia bacterium]|nr:VWA domain-containing protein [Verrucomicrobiota bacterium]
MRRIRRTRIGASFVAATLVFFLTSGRAYPQETYDNVVVVLDASGSMKGIMPGTNLDKMTAAKRAIKEVLRQVPPSTHVGLLVFSAEGLKDEWVHPLGPRNDAELTKTIDAIRAYGGTPLGKYIKMGADRLLEERAKQFGYGTFRLLVVTDGEAQDQALVERYTPEVMARGITVDVIGVAMNQAHTLARRVHSYRAANDPTALKRALTEVFAEVGGTATDFAQEEAFAALAPIPPELAGAAIQALSSSGNHPIGERPKASIAEAPKPPEKPPATPSQIQVAAQPPPPKPVASPRPPPQPPPPPSGNVGFSMRTLIIFVLCVIVLSAFVRKRR